MLPRRRPSVVVAVWVLGVLLLGSPAWAVANQELGGRYDLDHAIVRR